MFSIQPTVASNRALSAEEYEFIRKLVYDHCRINLGANKRELVMARLSKRLRACNIPDYRTYIGHIQTPQGKAELTNLIDAISTNHTFFFREGSHFEFLAKTVIPEHPRGETFRLWSAACSSGEEPYSIAILLSEYLKTVPFQIECSDISTKILAKAQEGIYPLERLGDMRRDWLYRYFQKGRGQADGLYRVKDSVRKNLHFRQLNLMSPTFPFNQPQHVIFCRNVMIYFDKATQEDLVNRFAKYLVPGGYLIIGHAESLTGIKHPYKTVRPAIYQKS